MAKILTLLVLLMTAVTGAWADTTVTWTTAEMNSNFYAQDDYEYNNSHYGITVTASSSSGPGSGGWYADGIGVNAEYTFTFTSTVGNIKSIVITAETINIDEFSAPTGWTINYPWDNPRTLSWNGTASTTVNLHLSQGQNFSGISTIVFTLSDPDYYLVGNMTSWEIDPQYKLALNESAGDANEYQIALALPAATELKVVSSTDGTAIKGWFPAEAGNKYVQNDGLYTIYFRPGYNGGDDWHAGCIYVADGVSLTADGEAWTLAQMPACDVELEVEYFPLATFTAPAAADGLIEGTVADLLTAGTSAEGTLNYAVSQSDTEAPASGWSETIPTTEGLDPGTYYVWYKVVGDAEHSDIQPQSIEVTIAALPTFAVTIDDGNKDAGNWQADPTEQKAGQKVTLTYGGKKKIRSITIEAAPSAPAAAEGHALSASVVGEIVGSDGKVYSVADKDNLPSGVTAVAMIAYVSDSNGLAIALADDGDTNLATAKSTCEGKAAIGGNSWKLPSQEEWKNMFKANGGNENSYTGLNNALAAAGGNSSKLQDVDNYWSSSMKDGWDPWVVYLENGVTDWYPGYEGNEFCVRACFAF